MEKDSSVNSQKRTTRGITSPKVTIIGAGLAGLTLAYRLSQQGYAVEIYEALGRAGGRVLTHYFEHDHAELGGHLIGYEAEAKSMLPLIEELKLPIDSYDIAWSVQIDYQGKALSARSLYQNGPLPTDELLKKTQQETRTCSNLAQVLDFLFKDHPQLRYAFDIQMRSYEGSPLEQLSAKHLPWFWEFFKSSYDLNTASSPQFNIKSVSGGNSKLIEALTEKLKGKIHYKKPLQAIQSIEGGGFQLRFADATEQSVDLLILAIPAAILKEIAVDARLEKAWKPLQKLPIGAGAKLLLPVQCQGVPPSELCHFEYGLGALNRDRTIMIVYSGAQDAQFGNDEASIQAHLDRLLPPLKRLFPNIIFPSKASEISAICWTHLPYFRGGWLNYGLEEYDALHVLSDVANEQVKSVFKPIDERLFFIGEHTTLAYIGSMDGAIESGERTARILQRLYPITG